MDMVTRVNIDFSIDVEYNYVGQAFKRSADARQRLG